MIAKRFLLAWLIMLGGISAAVAGNESLPLGDGKIAAAPQVGYIYSCQKQFGGGGAFRDGNWIAGAVWYPERKIHVQGSVAWPHASMSATLEQGQRVLRANDLPNHPTGEFPVAQQDPAYQYDRNPNSIRAQQIVLTLPLDPQIAAQSACLEMGMIGFALSGAAIFNGLDAGGRDAVAHEIQDTCNGHPERQGQYHYHGYSPCMSTSSETGTQHSDLLGYALDGFGIYGLHGENGKALTNADLDACHGHTHTALWNDKMQRVYHYHMTREYPYTLGCFTGTPISHMQQPTRQLQQLPQPMQGRHGNPQQMLSTAAQILGVSQQTLMQAVGPPPPNFSRASHILGISEDTIRAAFDRARAVE
jgi:hypothetical protein